MGLAVGLGHVPGLRDRDPARVGVLDHGHAGDVAVVVGGAHGGVGVRVVVVAHGLAVELAGTRHTGGLPGHGVDGGALVRVLAVAQGRQPLVGGAHVGGHLGRRRSGRGHGGLSVGGAGPGGGCCVLDPLREPGGHGGIVGSGVGEGVRGEPTALSQREAAGADGGSDVVVPGGVDHDGDARVVLGGGADHGGTADVDLLHAGVERGTGGHGGGERVEVDHHEVDRGDAELGQLGEVVGLAAVGEDAGVDAGVKGLDPALEALGEAGHLLHAGDRQSRLRDGGSGGAGGDDLDAGLDERAGEVHQAGLVVDGDEGAVHGDDVGVDQALGGDVGGGNRLGGGLGGGHGGLPPGVR